MAQSGAARTLRLYDAGEALDYLDELIAEHAALIEAHGGDIEAVPEIAELLAFAEADFDGAVERMALKIRNLIVEGEAVRIEAERLATLQRQKENAARRLKEYVKRHLEARGRIKIQFPLVRVRIQKNGQASVRATSEGLIEDLYAQGSEFIRRKETFDLDREKILAVHDAGGALPEGILVERGSHLRVE